MNKYTQNSRTSLETKSELMNKRKCMIPCLILLLEMVILSSTQHSLQLISVTLRTKSTVSHVLKT